MTEPGIEPVTQNWNHEHSNWDLSPENSDSQLCKEGETSSHPEEGWSSGSFTALILVCIQKTKTETVTIPIWVVFQGIEPVTQNWNHDHLNWDLSPENSDSQLCKDGITSFPPKTGRKLGIFTTLILVCIPKTKTETMTIPIWVVFQGIKPGSLKLHFTLGRIWFWHPACKHPAFVQYRAIWDIH